MQMWLSDEVVEARRKTHPPTQVRCKVGGVFLRDMRLWHAGGSSLSSLDQARGGLEIISARTRRRRDLDLPDTDHSGRITSDLLMDPQMISGVMMMAD